ncbi:tetratricopeptide repeat protein [Limibacter armeniacum]|uniref:tetratricopeptide repeat protein n=1 Tax=Limibacter armeniacum TaxID=466084 RepID=UPI002FE5A9B5
MKNALLLFFLLTGLEVVAGLPNKALNQIDSLKSLLNDTAMHDTTKVNVLGEIAWMYRYSSTDQMLAYSTETLELATQQNYLPGILLGSLSLSYVYFKKGSYDEALKHCDYILRRAEEIGDKEYMSYAFVGMAEIYIEKAFYEEASRYVVEAEEIASNTDYELWARILSCKGIVAKYSGEMVQSLELFEKALLYSQYIRDDFFAMKVLSSMGDLFLETKKYREAIEYYNKALGLQEKGNLETGYKAELLNKIAMVYLKLNQPQMVEYFTLRAIFIAKNVQDYEELQEGYYFLYKIEKMQGDPSRALKYLELQGVYKDSLLSSQHEDEMEYLMMLNSVEELERKLRLSRETHIEQREQHMTTVIVSFVTIGVLIYFAVGMYRENKAKNSAYDELTERQQEVENINEVLEGANKKLSQYIDDRHSSLRYAQKIQNALLPDLTEIREKVSESFFMLKPVDEVSGDFYWYAYLDGMAYIACIDCTGHGVPGAFMSVIADSLLGEMVFLNRMRSPGDILAGMQYALESKLSKQSSKVSDGMDIGLCCIDYEEQELHFSGAKISLVYYDGEGQKVIAGNRRSIGRQLGEREPHDEFEDHVLPIGNDQMYYMFSDGYADQFGGKAGKKLKRRGLYKILEAIQHLPAQDQYQLLESTFTTWKGDCEQVDDVLVIGFKV